MTPARALGSVLLPQALRTMLPSLANTWVALARTPRWPISWA